MFCHFFVLLLFYLMCFFGTERGGREKEHEAEWVGMGEDSRRSWGDMIQIYYI